MVGIYGLHSGITICLNNVPCLLLTSGSAFNPRSHAAISWHVSLISSNMEQGFHVLWSRVTLTVWKNSSQMPPGLNEIEFCHFRGRTWCWKRGSWAHFLKVPPPRSSAALEIEPLTCGPLGNIQDANHKGQNDEKLRSEARLLLAVSSQRAFTFTVWPLLKFSLEVSERVSNWL